MSYDAKAQWTQAFEGNKMAWPAEYVIRMFKGKYPNLDLVSSGYAGKRICDMGCGDGRNLVVLKELGFEVSGFEISEPLTNQIKTNLAAVNIKDADIRVGTNDKIPFEARSFDYLLSWNACYYMGQVIDFNNYLKEFSRVLKSEGTLVFSIPKSTCFIFNNSEPYKDGYQIIRNDPFKVRNGEIFRIFESTEQIEQAFSPYFKNFVFGSIHDDCFGFNYHWFIGTCQNK